MRAIWTETRLDSKSSLFVLYIRLIRQVSSLQERAAWRCRETGGSLYAADVFHVGISYMCSTCRIPGQGRRSRRCILSSFIIRLLDRYLDGDDESSPSSLSFVMMGSETGRAPTGPSRSLQVIWAQRILRAGEAASLSRCGRPDGQITR
jgi:hypothetical protein